MAVAGVVIETLPGKAQAVAGRLNNLSGLRIQGDDGLSRIVAIWKIPGRTEPESLAETLCAWDGDILNVLSTSADGEE
jgi:hypothetical protein